MKIIQDFKCYELRNKDNSFNYKYIDFELTKYQQTKWKFYKEKIYFIESSIHWNMLLFYIYNNDKNNKISITIQKKINNYYTFIVNIDKIDKELESIIFLYFYYDIHNRGEYILNESKNIYKWNNLYLDLKNKCIYTTEEYKYKINDGEYSY